MGWMGAVARGTGVLLVAAPVLGGCRHGGYTVKRALLSASHLREEECEYLRARD